jgi:hypothetical protein
MKALAARSTAIKSALTRYNTVAAQVGGKKITWDEITDMKVLADFDLLRGSRRGVLEQVWALPQNRQCVAQWRRALRAQEEIDRLNIEVRRVRTSIADEAKSLPSLVVRITTDNPQLGWAAERYVARRLRVNELVAHDLKTLEALPGYSGDRTCGIRIGYQPTEGFFFVLSCDYIV